MRKLKIISAALAIVMVATCLLTIVVVKGNVPANANTSNVGQPVINGYRSVMYVRSSSSEADIKAMDADKFTHINYAFLKVATNAKNGTVDQEGLNIKTDGSLASLSSSDVSRINALKGLKQSNPDLKILLSLAGGSEEQEVAMAIACNSATYRQTLCNQIKQVLQDYNLDGIDIDWEHPDLDRDGRYGDEGANMATFVRQLRETLGEDYLITIATPISSSYVTADLGHKNIQEMDKYMDFWNLMTYDLASSSYAGHNSPMKYNRNTSFSSIEDGVAMYHNAGIAYDKLVVGVPYYGKYVTSTNPISLGDKAENHPGGKWSGSGSCSTEEINDWIKNDGFTSQNDTQSGASYLTGKIGSTYYYVTYTSADQMKARVDYVAEKNLGGIMVWSYDHDSDDLTLTNLISQELNSVKEGPVVDTTNVVPSMNLDFENNSVLNISDTPGATAHATWSSAIGKYTGKHVALSTTKNNSISTSTILECDVADGRYTICSYIGFKDADEKSKLTCQIYVPDDSTITFLSYVKVNEKYTLVNVDLTPGEWNSISVPLEGETDGCIEFCLYSNTPTVDQVYYMDNVIIK